MVAVVRVGLRFNSPLAKRSRTINKNKLVVDSISAYLPGDREKFTPGVGKAICRKTAFTPTEVFRKYLWYLLQEREFNQEAVDDMVHLKRTLGLEDAQVCMLIYI